MFIAGKILTSLLLMFGAASLLTSCEPAAKDIVIKPVEIDSTLLNPGRGFTSTGRTFNDNLGNRLHPACGISQQRFYWEQLEPEEGKLNYALIDSVIQRCVSNGQQLNFRVMCQDVDMHLPKWALDAGVKSPFYDNPVFLEKQENLIKALAARYDGHPAVCFVDIGTVGQWGEWHVDPDAKDPNKIRFPNDTSVQRIVNAYLASFTKTPLVALISLEKQRNGFKYATGKGTGWRADCWGDMDSLGWNHMKGVYPQAIANAGATDAWKNGPVAFETCWTMNEWYKRGWDLDYILNKALEWHATGVNNGSESIPEAWYPKVKEFEKKLGYRFVLNQLTYSSEVKKGEDVKWTTRWNNKGVAPVYNSYRVAFRFVSKTNPEHQAVVATNSDMKKLLPGASDLQSTVSIPAGLQPGEYDLQLGIVPPGLEKPAIQLAIAGKTTDGWYQMGKIKVTG
jgi:uncharacterized protein DUF4832